MIREITGKNDKCKIIAVSGQRNKAVEDKLRVKGVYEYVDKETDGTDYLCEVIAKIIEEEKNKINPSASHSIL